MINASLARKPTWFLVVLIALGWGLALASLQWLSQVLPGAGSLLKISGSVALYVLSLLIIMPRLRLAMGQRAMIKFLVLLHVVAVLPLLYVFLVLAPKAKQAALDFNPPMTRQMP